MNRNALTAKLTRNAPGSYTITVDGVYRGEVFKRADGDWQATVGKCGWVEGTKREVVKGLHSSDWDRDENELIRAHNDVMGIK